MTTWWKVVSVVSVILGSLFLVVLVVYLANTGLERADKVASVVSAFVGIVGLGMGVVGLVRCRATPCIPAVGRSVSNSVTGSVIGNVVQGHTVEGGIRLRSDG